MRAMTLVLGLGLSILPSSAFAQETAHKAEKVYFESKIRPLLVTHCYRCHSKDAEKLKGDFRMDRLSPEFADGHSREGWQAVLKRIKAGEMPPKGKPRLLGKDAQTLYDWIGAGFKTADARRAAEGRVVLRRLNRIEYENTVRDLLGVPVELKEMLPIDSSSAGFDNVADALHTSSFLMEKYLEGAEKALNLAIANGPQPPLIKKRYSLKDSHNVKLTTESVYLKRDDGTVVCFSSSAWNAVHLTAFYPPDRGKYRFRISASGYQSTDKPVTYRLDAGQMGMVGHSHLVGYFDAAADKATVLEFVDHLEARSTIRILPYGLACAQTVHKIGADKYEGKGLAVQWIDVEGPIHDTWPPESHRRIFGDLPRKPAPSYNFSNRVEVASTNPEADAERILRGFARRAFRRAVTDEDLKPFLKLVKNRLERKHTFEQAIRVGLMGVMVSPDFLFLRDKAGKLDDFALASRLSYFLWSTMPDEELLTLAEQKKLSDPKTLHAQVERMLKDRRAAAFTENFVSQWLNLREIDATIPSHIHYPEYDDMLKHSMLKETYLFFDEVLKNDLSLTNFVHSDFTMLNGRLARHYDLKKVKKVSGPFYEKGPDTFLVEGWEFKKVTLPKDSHRGGVITMASVMKVTANGTYTSPILRGAWVLERILGTPPPRPPEGVAAVEPDIRGAKTIRQQLAKHRDVPSCASCHSKIDPPGFALESFDVIGGWRDYYRTSGNGKEVIINGRRMPYLQGPNVDPADVTADGQKFKDIDEFKQILLKDKDQLARNLTERLVTYSTGAAPQTGDQKEIEAIICTVRDRNYGLRTLVHEVVQSRLFLHK
jgi:mono/diheme cytochrome c family protein